MAETKWTPGPWFYRPLEWDDWGWVRSSEADGQRTIAHATALPIRLERTGVIEFDLAAEADELERHRRAKTDPYEANARLIAAAPELYDILFAICDDDTTPMRDDYYRTARAALAKARGEP